MNSDLRAVLDIGSNTIRLLVGRVRDGIVAPALDRSKFVRLGLEVDATGGLRDDRRKAAVDAIRDLSNLAKQTGASSIVAIATSAVRDAKNGPDFIAQVKSETGVDVAILSGDEEARLTYLGATMGASLGHGTIVCDLGGGSAEIIYARDGSVQWSESLPLGSGRLTERFIHHDPPHDDELSSLRAYVREVLSALPDVDTRNMILTGGTATHIARLAGKEGNGILLEPAELTSVRERVSIVSVKDIVDSYGVEPERAKVLAAGTTAVDVIASFYRAESLVIARSGIREGTLLDRVK